MKKSAYKKILLISLLALPLLSCGNTSGKTNELKPNDVQVSDKHEAVSSLGKALKASSKNNALSIIAKSNKDLKVVVEETIANSADDSTTERKVQTLASGIEMDLRAKSQKDDAGGEDKVQSSFGLSIDALIYGEPNDDLDKFKKNGKSRSDLALTAYAKDDVYYIDPTTFDGKVNNGTYNTLNDLCKFVGLDYSTVIRLALGKKYSITKENAISLLDKTDIDVDIEGLSEFYKNLIVENKIDEFVAEFDKRIENWAWLTPYTDKNGNITLYASLNKAELCAFLDEIFPLEQASSESLETYADKLAGLDLTSLELSVAFNESGLQAANTVFAFSYSQNDVPFYENSVIQLPDTNGNKKSQTGTANIKTKANGGFKFAFGQNAPLEPSSNGWTDISTLLKMFGL